MIAVQLNIESIKGNNKIPLSCSTSFAYTAPQLEDGECTGSTGVYAVNIYLEL